ncbi:maleylpyruvate isomerase N-terminal domain-containing protein [Streptomyces sp. NPDC127074]|uniref:maleylpyruvate isomerase N-terminal domain-containing protein n=1 Tax=Streptomyces sp. NPDC127074 TaxID=3347130 RepID=UPI0036563F08
MAYMLNYNLAVPDVDDAGVLAALVAEGDDLDMLVTAVDDWSIPTPAPGWTVAHQIAHLAWSDANALSALRTPDAFSAELGGRKSKAAGTPTRPPPRERPNRGRYSWTSGGPVDRNWRRRCSTRHGTTHSPGTWRR